MIPPTPAIDAFIAPRYDIVGIQFDKIQATFSSRYRQDIKNLENVLRADNLAFVVKRGFLWRWELTLTIPIVGPYTEEEHQQIIGKIFSLASQAIVHLRSILLIG